MKNTLISGGIALLLLSAPAMFAQTKLVEKVTKTGSELVIPYEKYLLPNGLTVIIHEDHSDPVVYVDVTYHVGSAREQEGRSGFAHFFEHMMFQGSEHVADEQHFKLVTEAGGTLNGTTNTDRTNYFEVLPSNQLETAMWLESDRMGFLLDSVTQKKFEVQRATVKNERGQNYDNRPYGIAPEKVAAALYPPNHPYSWLTIGYIEDLNRVDVNDLKKFFLRWYGPNNATLTVAGDVKVADVLKYAEKYFGPIPRGAEVTPQSFAAVSLPADRYISYEDNIRLPQLSFDFPTVPSHDKDEAPLDILAEILGGGKSSIFYKNFVKTQMAQMAVAEHPTKELSGEMEFTVRTTSEHTLAQMDSLLRASLVEFEKRGVTDDDLIRFKATYEASLINSLSSVQGKGAQLASNQTFTGNPNYIVNDLERYNKVTKEDVMRVYNTYIKGHHAVVLSVYPKGKSSLVAKADNYTPPARTVAAESAEYKTLVYNKGKDSFDRRIKPTPGPAPLVSAPDYWLEKEENGLRYIGAKSNEIPTVTIQVNIEAGHRSEDKAKAGLSSLTASLMNEGTEQHTAEEISDMMRTIGGSVSVVQGSQDIIVYISSLTKNLDKTLEIANEIMFHPKFAAADFERVKKQYLEAIASQATQATVIANNVFAKLLYGSEHIMSVPNLGTKESISALTLDDVKKYYAEKFSPSLTRVVVVGDIDKTTALSKLKFLNTWPAKAVAKPAAEPALPVIDKTRIYFVNKDKAAQSEIRIGNMALPFDATDEYFKATIMNYILGGAFNSRINLNLREAHGYTYGARSGFSGTKYTGPFTASAGVRTNVTDSSVIEFMKEIRNYAGNGITKDELLFTQNSIGQSEALKYETQRQKAGFMSRILDYNLSKDFVAKQNAVLKSMDVNQVNLLAKKYLPYNNMIILVVGDKSKVYDGLAKLGFDIIELDADGNVIKPLAQEEIIKEAPKNEPVKPANPQPPANGQKRVKGLDPGKEK